MVIEDTGECCWRLLTCVPLTSHALPKEGSFAVILCNPSIDRPSTSLVQVQPESTTSVTSVSEEGAFCTLPWCDFLGGGQPSRLHKGTRTINHKASLLPRLFDSMHDSGTDRASAQSKIEFNEGIVVVFGKVLSYGGVIGVQDRRDLTGPGNGKQVGALSQRSDLPTFFFWVWAGEATCGRQEGGLRPVRYAYIWPVRYAPGVLKLNLSNVSNLLSVFAGIN